jgi:hypothetical protein
MLVHHDRDFSRRSPRITSSKNTQASVGERAFFRQHVRQIASRRPPSPSQVIDTTTFAIAGRTPSPRIDTFAIADRTPSPRIDTFAASRQPPPSPRRSRSAPRQGSTPSPSQVIDRLRHRRSQNTPLAKDRHDTFASRVAERPRQGDTPAIASRRPPLSIARLAIAGHR